MNRTLLSLALSAAFATAPAQAGPLEDRIELLSRQVLVLQGQVSQLRSMLNRDSTGKVVVTATANRNDLVGTDFSTSVGGNASSSFGRALALAVGQSRSTQIGLDDVLTVSGASTSTVNGNWRLNVGGEATSNFARSHSHAIGQSRTTQIGVNDVLSVTGSSTSNVGGNWTLSINGGANQQVANNLAVSAGREILIQAGDQILLRTGDSSLLMKKDGTIVITGKMISAIASGDVVLKGSKVLTN
jgi:type VI secretion system secreted protein VgrG